MSFDQRSLMHTFQSLTALVVGESRSQEFSEGLAVLSTLADTVEVTDVPTAALYLVDDCVCPDLVVLVQDRPGEFSVQQVLDLRRAAPLARFVGLLGSWCEGETRTGTALPGVIRVYWYDAAARLTDALSALASGRCPAWGLPLTAGDDELLLAANREPQPPQNGLILLAMRHFDSAEALAEACRARGYAAVWMPTHQMLVDGATAIVWDGSVMGRGEVEELSAIVSRYPATPVIAVLDFPRFDSLACALTHGAACVLARPLLLDDLFGQIAQLAPACTIESRTDMRQFGQVRVDKSGNAA